MERTIKRQFRDSASADIAPPKRLDQTKWTDSYLILMKYLMTHTSADGKRTIDYVVRIDKPLEWLATTLAERLLYEAALSGLSFVKDYQEVYRIVKQWILNNPAFAWVRPFDRRKDGRGAVVAMRAHYDGPGETSKKLAMAEADLKNLHLQ